MLLKDLFANLSLTAEGMSEDLAKHPNWAKRSHRATGKFAGR